MEIISRIGLILLKILSFIIGPWIYLVYFCKKKTIPPIMDPLLQISASELVQMIQKKQITSSQLVQAYIKRAKEVNQIINAYVDERFELAMKEAEAVDAMVRNNSDKDLLEEYPLLGIPISVKEPCPVKGLSHTGAIPARKGIKAEEDADCIKKLKDAGAIVICNTNIPVWCTGLETVNPIYGRTLNPYNTCRTVGGSSGGEAALIGSAGSLLGLSSDMAGSTRIPAMFNGVFGHKPTQEIISMDGWFPVCQDKNFKSYHTFGQITRYASDLPILLKVMCGSKAESLLHLDETVDICKLKVLYYHTAGSHLGLTPIDAEIQKGIFESANYLKSLGCEIEELKMKDLEDIYEICCVKYLRMDWKNALEETAGIRRMNFFLLTFEILKKLVFASEFSYAELNAILLIHLRGLVPESRVQHYFNKCDSIKEEMISLLENKTVLLFPTFATTAFIHFLGPGYASCPGYSAFWNLVGVPATQVPMGLSKNGMPYGLQVISGLYNDRYCLAVAKELERKFGGWRSPCSKNYELKTVKQLDMV